ncbi:MAG: hypothetical protein RLZZ480_704 [Candidatus Parcubacteria bacterium]|jgi:hypothetical protein
MLQPSLHIHNRSCGLFLVSLLSKTICSTLQPEPHKENMHAYWDTGPEGLGLESAEPD